MVWRRSGPIETIVDMWHPDELSLLTSNIVPRLNWEI